MSKRQLMSSGSPFEPEIGFSRGVRIGAHIAVSGTPPIAASGGVASPGDAHTARPGAAWRSSRPRCGRLAARSMTSSAPA